MLQTSDTVVLLAGSTNTSIATTNLSTVDVLDRRFTEEEVHHSVVMERTHEIRICTKQMQASFV